MKQPTVPNTSPMGLGPKDWQRWLLGIVAGTMFMAAAFYMFFYQDERPNLPMPADYISEATLFFGAKDGKSLAIEKRALTLSNMDGKEEQVRALVSELLIGSKEGFSPILPVGSKLIGVTIEGSVANIDISSALVEKHWGGSSAEILTVYGVVNTITVNVDEIKKVQFLVDGEIVKTIAGHIRIELPLDPDLSMVKN